MGIRVTDYEQITDVSSAVGLTVPNLRTNYCIIDVRDQDVRWRSDGTDPTASVGGYLEAGSQYEHAGNLDDLRFIEVVAGAELNITYYFRTGGDHQ